jgi:hypothetical protein
MEKKSFSGALSFKNVMALSTPAVIENVNSVIGAVFLTMFVIIKIILAK